MAITIRSFRLPSYYSYSLYDVIFYGDTVKTLVTHTPGIVETWISDILRLHSDRLDHLIVGLDIEWRPNMDRPAILQLCVGQDCLIFQICRVAALEIPQSLIRFLTDYTFVGVGIESDVAKLLNAYGLLVTNTIELRQLAADSQPDRERLRIAGVVDITREILGRHIRKPRKVALSNWERDLLSLDQIRYACIDAYVAFLIGLSLIEGA